MDQTFSLPQPTPPATLSPAATAQSQSGAAEEDPESPGRSPRQSTSRLAGPDPLAEGLALMAGMALALMALLVPLATVVCDSQPIETRETVRAGW